MCKLIKLLQLNYHDLALAVVISIVVTISFSVFYFEMKAVSIEEYIKSLSSIHTLPKEQEIMIEAGARVNISATEIALVHGSDICPKNPLFWAETEKPNLCLLLKNKETSDVYLTVGFNGINEVWSANYNLDKLVITRPNGWIVTPVK